LKMNTKRFFSPVDLVSASLTATKKAVIWLLLFLAVSNLTTNAATILHDISTGILTIPGNSTDDYIITGATKTNYVVVEAGYHGVITLRNVNISLFGYNSPISVKGENNRSNLTPITNVDIILEGENFLSVEPGECKEFRQQCWTIGFEQYKRTYWLDVQTNIWYRKSCYLNDEMDDWECHDDIIEDRVLEYCWHDDWLGYRCHREWFENGCYKICDRYEWSNDWECYEDWGDAWTRPRMACGDVCEGDDCRENTWTECEEVYGIAAFHVEQGAQINIRAIDPSDHTSGKLNAIVTTDRGGAGIGALNRMFNSGEATGTAPVTGGCEERVTAGGNIVISSGTIVARGGHGAGIGGGYVSYYDGMIVIYGGIVDASAIRHSAGIGSGCPLSRGVESCYTPNSAIIVLPPAQITATGAHNYDPRADLALAGASYIIYIGDPEKPLITVHTEDFEPFANIYVDLSENPNAARVINATVPEDRLDINKIWFGQAGSNGIYQFHGVLEDNTTFFTDAVSSTPASLGRPYRPKTVQLPDGSNVDRTVILELLDTGLSVEAAASIPLCENYTASDALTSAFRVKIIFSDDFPMSNVLFEIAGGSTSDFLSGNDMVFYSSDGITEIPAPTTLNKGDVIYVVFPLKTEKTADIYSDVFRFSGTWQGIFTGYIRQVITQNVESLHVFAIASPAEGGTVSVSGAYPCGENVTVSATPNEGYQFVNWTRGTQTVATNEMYTFTTTEDVTLVAHFELKTYAVTVLANPPEGGAVSGGGTYTHGDNVTVSATPNTGYMFEYWSEDGVNISTDAECTFKATDSRTLVANFCRVYTVNADVNHPDYGYTTGSGDYPQNAIAKVEAIVYHCYRFANWTVNGIVVSVDNPYEFIVTEDVHLIANFYALDFDTYAPTLWDNTFMLNLKKLEEEGYEVTGCKWFKNGIEESDTRTINEFSYSAGDNDTDLLEPEPAFYMFQLITKNFGALCSSTKTIIYHTSDGGNKSSDILAYPNPLPSGSRLTIEGVIKGSVIYVYNQTGAQVYSAVATDRVFTLTLPVAGGIYLIRNGSKTIKIVVTN